jgi:hypothetical protein
MQITIDTTKIRDRARNAVHNVVDEVFSPVETVKSLQLHDHAKSAAHKVADKAKETGNKIRSSQILENIKHFGFGLPARKEKETVDEQVTCPHCGQWLK